MISSYRLQLSVIGDDVLRPRTARLFLPHGGVNFMRGVVLQQHDLRGFRLPRFLNGGLNPLVNINVAFTPTTT